MLAVAPSLLDAIHGDLHRPRAIVYDRQERPCIGGDGGGGRIVLPVAIALRRIEHVRVDQRRIIPWSDPRVLHAIEQHAVEHHEHPEAFVRLRATRLPVVPVASLAVEEVVLVDGGALAPHPRRDRQPVLAAHRLRRRELGHPSARAVEVESRARVADAAGAPSDDVIRVARRLVPAVEAGVAEDARRAGRGRQLPAVQVGIERGRVPKGAVEAQRASDVPRADVGVEPARVVEHVLEPLVAHLGDVPLADVAVEQARPFEL